MTEPKVSKEVAEDEFVRMCEARDLDVDTSDMDEEDKKRLESLRKSIVKAIMLGRIVVLEDGTVEVRLRRPVDQVAVIRFGRPTGATLVALSGKKTKSNIEDAYLAAANMSDVPKAIFDRLDYQADGKLVTELVPLFLG